MPRTPSTRLPIGPLVELTRAACAGELAARVGLARETVQRYHRAGIPEPMADRIAARLDLHPANIWPDFHDRRTHIRPTRKATT